jgi:hypothetical protein
MRLVTASHVPRVVVAFAVLAILAAPAAAQRGRQRAEDPEPVAVHTRARIAGVLDRVEEGAELKPAIAECQAIFDEAIAWAPLERPEAIRDAALALRMLRQLDATTSVSRAPTLRYLRANGRLAADLAFLVTADDEVDRVYWRLAKIIEAYPQEAAELPALTAAVCVVHEGPVTRPLGPQANLNPVEIFDYFRAIPGAVMEYKAFPPEIMVYLVNTRADP